MNVPSDTPTTRSSKRRPAVAAVLAVVAAALVVLALTTGGSGSDPAAASPGTATSAAPTAAPTTVVLAPAADTPAPTGPTTDADEPPANLAPVPLDQPAAVGDGVTARVVSLDAVDATGVGPGNVTGPALRVTVALTNGKADALPLGGVAVDLASGPELVPASPVNDPAAAPFSGTVAAGGTAQGVYVFSIAAADRADVTLSVGYEAGAPVLVFTGAAS
ncbi:conserved exported protein of unknown function [Modestobacter italicus]|uniref:DUF4352 domain-containing protein n=1 Tax=Modestobacter italicus (strain DSM 44449 / CECT 9708 / BC 501) TaxID=2732864 RepID=I4ESP8_MODI5|nr:hypothetical protein [Modestobacter marinus]CCH86411.1 conserved exported protein of unknown function [Modestobacter marinus]